MTIKLRYGNTNTFLVTGKSGYLLVDTDYAGMLLRVDLGKMEPYSVCSGVLRPVGKDHVRFDMVPVGKLVSEVAEIFVRSYHLIKKSQRQFIFGRTADDHKVCQWQRPSKRFGQSPCGCPVPMHR